MMSAVFAAAPVAAFMNMTPVPSLSARKTADTAVRIIKTALGSRRPFTATLLTV